MDNNYVTIVICLYMGVDAIISKMCIQCISLRWLTLSKKMVLLSLLSHKHAWLYHTHRVTHTHTLTTLMVFLWSTLYRKRAPVYPLSMVCSQRMPYHRPDSRGWFASQKGCGWMGRWRSAGIVVCDWGIRGDHTPSIGTILFYILTILTDTVRTDNDERWVWRKRKKSWQHHETERGP